MCVPQRLSKENSLALKVSRGWSNIYFPPTNITKGQEHVSSSIAKVSRRNPPVVIANSKISVSVNFELHWPQSTGYSCNPVLDNLLFTRLNFSGNEEFFAGAVYVQTDMALVFLSRPLMDSFANARQFFLDGTFQTVPIGVYQLLTIHVAAYANVSTLADHKLTTELILFNVAAFRHSQWPISRWLAKNSPCMKKWSILSWIMLR
jgi:hypothetical protein